MRRGFTLVEVMVSVAIMGIIAALATPSVLPIIHRSELGNAAHALAGFVREGRLQAMSLRSCVQLVPLAQTDIKRPQTVLLRGLNTRDCDGAQGGFQTQTIASAPKVSGTNQWNELDKLIFDTHRVRITMGPVMWPTSLTDAEECSTELALSAALGTVPSPCRDLRFRPTGRVWQPEHPPPTRTDEQMTIRLTHTQSLETMDFTIGSNGFMTRLPRKGTP
jgi:prepilin-type N-terminal cleavage/methylation domain-containing protein